MKNYTITVNGVSYDVSVEENTGSSVTTSSSEVVTAPQAATKKAQTPNVAAPKATPAPKAAPAGGLGNMKINAPMPGKILAVKVSNGQAVKKGEVILILEAMKMENEIVAPEAGTVASINVAVGDMVEAGVLLATLN